MRKLRSRTTQRRHQKGFKRDPSGPKMHQNKHKMQKSQQNTQTRASEVISLCPKKGSFEHQILVPQGLSSNLPSIGTQQKNPKIQYS